MPNQSADLICPGTYTGPLLGFAPAVTAGLVGMFFARGDGTGTIVNYATDTNGAALASGAINGAPAYSMQYATFDSLNSWLDTLIAETDDISIMTIGRAAVTPTSNANSFALAGNHINIASGVYLALTASGFQARRVINSATPPTVTPANSAVATMTEANPTAFKFRGAVFHGGTGGYIRLLNPSAGLSPVQISEARPPVQGSTLRCGSSDGTFDGTGDMAWMAIYAGVKSDNDFSAMRTQMKTYYESRTSGAIMTL